MKKNVSKVDMIIRLVIGIVIIIVGILTGSWWGLIGLIPVITALMKWCPLYTVCGKSSSKMKEKESEEEAKKETAGPETEGGKTEPDDEKPG